MTTRGRRGDNTGSFLRACLTVCVILVCGLRGFSSGTSVETTTNLELIQLKPISPIEGSFVIITQQMVQVLYNQTSLCIDCVLTILPMNSTIGRFVNISQSLETDIDSFTYDELTNHEIALTVDVLDKEVPLVYAQPIGIALDDETFIEAVLNVTIIPISLTATIQYSSGSNCSQSLDLLSDATSVIIPRHSLHVEMNQIQRLPEVMVELVTYPSHGVLKYGDNNATLPTLFSYTLFIEEEITYLIDDHKVQTTFDSFDVRLSLGHGTSEIVTIVLCIEALPYPNLTKLGSLTTYITGLKVLTPDVLKATQSRYHDTRPQDLVYYIVATPKYGVILHESMPSSIESIYEFTQDDVNKGKIFYVNKNPDTNGSIRDQFQVRLRNQYYELDTIHTVLINFKENKIEVVNRGITVEEGGIHNISSNELSSTVPDGYELKSLYLIQRPNSGTIVLRRPSPEPMIEDPRHFVLSDIENGYLFYNHSGSEGIMDMFNVLFVAQKEGYETLDLPVWINVTIIPVNDLAPSKLTFRPMEVTEGSSTPITLDYLEYEDEDYGYNNDDLIYVMSFQLFVGEICLNGSCTVGYDGYQWHQRDMRLGNLVYKHTVGDGPIALIPLLIYDYIGGHSTGSYFRVNINPVEPERTGGTAIHLLEGGTQTINAFNIEFSSDGVAVSEYQYNVTKRPLVGSLVWTSSSLPVEEFTQSDVNNGLIMYHHDGSNSVTDSFQFSLSVRSHHKTYTVPIVIIPVDDDPPQLLTQTPIFVGFMKSIHLNHSQLQISDTDTDNPDDLQYVIKTNVKYGIIEKRSGINGNTYNQTTTFTQRDIDNENVRYKHTHPKTEQGLFVDYFSFDISDGSSNTVGPYNASIYVLPNQVDVTVLGSTVLEGHSVVLPYDSIIIHHPYFAGTEGKVSIPVSVKHGNLRINGKNCTLCDFYTDDLANGNIEYVHSGGEDESDSFHFFIDWQGLLRTNYINYTITILPVNDQPPTIAVSSHLNIWAKEVITLTPSLLLTTDPDSTPDQLLYHFYLTAEQEADGYFSRIDTPNQINHTFTQEDINNGVILYVDKRNYNGFDRQFRFNVTDGRFTVDGEVSVTARVVSLQLIANTRLEIGMGQRFNISKKQLKYFTNNDQIVESMITYHISKGFKYGGIYDANNGQERTNFTQADIDANQLIYLHTGIDIWEPVDSAVVTISAPLAEDVPITIGVDIDLLNESNPLARNRPLSVMEGSMVCITQDDLDGRNVRYNSWKAAVAEGDSVSLADTYLMYTVTKPPTHGLLTLNHTQVTDFYHTNLSSGLLCYQNDGSESAADSILFDVVITTPFGEIGRVSDTLYANITLVNDEEPLLISTNNHFTITNGFWFPVTSSDLEVVDEDNRPQEITFTVINKPRELSLRVTDTIVSQFTQDDVNSGRVTIFSNKTGNSTFSLSYSDGKHMVSSLSFDVYVHEHVLLVVDKPTLNMFQTQQEVSIDAQVVNTTTNGRRHETQYTVTHSPDSGQILVNGEPADVFLQTDIDSGRVSYRVTSTHAARDSLQLTVTNTKVTKTLSIDVVINANGDFGEQGIFLRPDTVADDNEVMVQVPSYVMKLQHLYDEYRDINIRITSKLEYGALYFKYPNTQGGLRQVDTFEYSDLKNGFIYYKWEPKEGLMAFHNYTEVITGVVEVVGLAPGEFTLSLTLQAPVEVVVSEVMGTPTQQQPRPSETGTPDTGASSGSSESGSSQFNLALYVPLIGFIIVIVIGFVVVVGFCCSQSRHIKRKLYHKTSRPGMDFNRASPTLKSSSVRQSPTRLPHSPQLTGGFDQEYSDSESSSPDVMTMTQGHTQQPMTTISASHTYLPAHSQSSFDPLSSGYHTQQQLSPTLGSGSPTFLRHQQESPIVPNSGNYPNPSYGVFSRNELRSSSPVRKINGSRRNTRQYASMTISTGKGKTSPTRSREYSSPLHVLASRGQVRDSTSSLGYDTSSMTQESSRVPSVANPAAPINLDAIINQEGISDLYRRTHPLLKPSQHWV